MAIIERCRELVLAQVSLVRFLTRRFVSIATSDGFAVASSKAARKIARKLASRFRVPRWATGDACRYFSPMPRVDAYRAWLAVNAHNPARRRRIESALKPPGREPRFSIVVPAYDPPIELLRALFDSVVNQSFSAWELIVVDDASSDPCVRQEIREWVSRDGRIRAIFRDENGNISVATDQAVAAAQGEFLVFADHDDLLARDALAHLAIHLDLHPDTDLVYSDDDKIELDGRRHSPQFKPDWSPELLLSFCYTAHLSAVRRQLYSEVGGLRVGFEGSQDHDFWLRAGERARRIGHVPQVLYHWRIVPGSTALSGHCKPASFEAGRQAVLEAWHRRGVPCSVVQPDWAVKAGCAIFEPVMPDDGPSVAILIPSRNQWHRLKTALDSLAQTTYRNYRIYVIDNESDDRATLEFLAALPHRVLRIPSPGGQFNFAAINNAAAASVEEDLLLFLNDDTEVVSPRWLSQMVGWSRLPGVGSVGARLLFPDKRIQHAGIVHGLHEGLAGCAFRLLPWWDNGVMSLARVSRNCLAVTAACMLTPRTLFLSMGGFDEERFAVAYNDADYGYRLVDAGYRNVYCAEAELIHHEGASRGLVDDPREIAAYREVHGRRIDPYFNPHLDLAVETFETKPTVVPVSGPRRPIAVLGVTHNLNCEGAPKIELELLSRLRAAGSIEPEALSPCDGPLRHAFLEAGIPLRVVPTLGRLALHPATYQDTIMRVANVIKAGGYEVVHANTLQTFWAIDAARAAGVPSVWSVHESERWQTYFDTFPRKIAAAALACLAYPYRVVFSAQSAARVWADLNSRSNFELVRFAYDPARFRASLEGVDREQARRELHVGERDLCVLLLGTVCQRKGQHDLLRAFAALPSHIAANTKCFVVGARESLAYSRALVEMARLLPADRRDRFVVVSETDDTAHFWRAADVFCCTSRGESYPLVTLEAMALGLPLVTTLAFGIADQVRESYNALTYHPGDTKTLGRHLVTIATDLPKRHALGAGSTWMLRTLPGHVRTEQLYRRIIEAAAESAPAVAADLEVQGAHLSQGSPEREGGIWMVGSARSAAALAPHGRRTGDLAAGRVAGRD